MNPTQQKIKSSGPQTGQNGNCLPVRSPLLSLSAVSAILYCDTGKVVALVEDGSLEFAFDIRTASSERQCLRIFTPSVVEYVEGKNWLDGRKWKRANLPEGEVFKTIFPTAQEYIPASIVARRLNCDIIHVNRLITDKSLIQHGKRPHQFRAIPISRASCFRFLKQRRLL